VTEAFLRETKKRTCLGADQRRRRKSHGTKKSPSRRGRKKGKGQNGSSQTSEGNKSGGGKECLAGRGKGREMKKLSAMQYKPPREAFNLFRLAGVSERRKNHCPSQLEKKRKGEACAAGRNASYPLRAEETLRRGGVTLPNKPNIEGKG